MKLINVKDSFDSINACSKHVECNLLITDGRQIRETSAYFGRNMCHKRHPIVPTRQNKNYMYPQVCTLQQSVRRFLTSSSTYPRFSNPPAVFILNMLKILAILVVYCNINFSLALKGADLSQKI